jgi:hypothetical protein
VHVTHPFLRIALRHAGFASLALVALLASPARAGVSADQCIESNNTAQSLRRSGKFDAARAELKTCADASCPRLVRNDCVQRIDDLDRAQPSIVFDLKDADGNDVVAVKVSVDGRPLAERLTGTALQVDPGEHVFSFEAAGLTPVQRTIVLKEGEKGRRERLVLTRPPGPQAVPIPLAQSPSDQAAAAARHGLTTRRLVGLVVGGTGLAGTAVGTAFGLLAISANNAQKNDCNTMTCPHHLQAVSEHSALETDGTVSTVAFIAGGALIVTGAVLFFTGGGASKEASSSLIVAPSLGSGSGGVAVWGRF